MFGLNDDTQKSNDDPAMLDNVKDLVSQPASEVEPPQQAQPSVATASTPSVAPVNAPSVPPQSPVGFSMPSDNPPSNDSPAPTTTSDNNSTSENTNNSDDTFNPGHIEPVEGFSSTPITTNVDSQTENSSDQSAPDTGTPASDTQSDNSETGETPQISQHTTTTLRVASSSPTSTEPEQNNLTAPPEPVVSAEPPNNTQPDESTTAVEPASSDSSEISAVNHDELESIKKEALGHLDGLTDHIDGSPEEVFRSTMQLIQANDNHTLLQKALDAAKKIEDDKLRAKAMLDIVNETNYFSENSNDN